MRDRIARRCYNRALASSTNVEGFPLKADGASGRSSGCRLLLLGATLECLGTHRGLEA